MDTTDSKEHPTEDEDAHKAARKDTRPQWTVKGVAPETRAAVTEAAPRSPGDLDGDRDVDQEDFGLLQACLTGSGKLPQAGCENADLDGDLDVDENDVGILHCHMNGPGIIPDC